jgi:ferredoxin-NADP reductase
MHVVSTVLNTPVIVTLLLAGGHQCPLPPMEASHPILKRLLTQLADPTAEPDSGLFEMVVNEGAQTLYLPARHIIGLFVSPPIHLLADVNSQEQRSTAPSPLPETSISKTTLLRCVRIIQETLTTKTILFVPDSTQWFDYKPGQQLILGVEIEGTWLTCAYFIGSSPTRPHTIDITIQHTQQERHPFERLSNWLYDHLQVGSETTAEDLPTGQFICPTNPSDQVLLISDGMGINPFMSLLRWASDTDIPIDIILVHSAPTLDDILFQQELVEFSYRIPNFQLVMTLTESSPNQVWLGYRGPVTDSLLQSVADDLLSRNVYVCGDDQFLVSIWEILQSQGLPQSQYHAASLHEQVNNAAIANPSDAQRFLDG